MRIGVMSDLHRRHWRKSLWGDVQLNVLVEWAKRERPDFIVDAGDWELEDAHVELGRYATIVRVPGNHDYYGSSWSRRDRSVETFDVVIGDVRVVGATLWTGMMDGNPILMCEARQTMNDYNCIENFTPESCVRAYERHIEFLQERLSEADVVVTHHAPTMQSISEQYRGQTSNYFFANALEEVVADCKARLWVHGHVHHPCDYDAGGTRVLANPCGYPGERYNPLRAYEPIVIEI